MSLKLRSGGARHFSAGLGPRSVGKSLNAVLNGPRSCRLWLPQGVSKELKEQTPARQTDASRYWLATALRLPKPP